MSSNIATTGVLLVVVALVLVVALVAVVVGALSCC